jgi:uncharacterized membrane protein
MEVTTKRQQGQRIFELDFIRGILIFLMCLQHLCWFFYRYLYCGIWEAEKITASFLGFGKLTNEILYVYPYNLTAMSIAWCLYFLMAGISFTFSRKNYKRSAITVGFFLLVYVVAVLCQNFMKYPVVLNFGMFLGYAVYMLIFQLIRRFPLWFHIAISAILLVLAICCQVFEFNFELNPLRWFGLSQSWNMGYLDEWFIMPSLFFYALGGVIGRTIYKNKTSKLQQLNKWVIFKPLLWLGKHSMMVYVANIIAYPLLFIILTAIINGGLL